MEWLRRSIRRLKLLIRRESAERSVDEELRYHIECETAERIRSGMAPEAARLSALHDFGGIERFKEEARDARGVRPLEDFLADTRYAARILRRNPGFAAASIATFAVAIAAASAIFSVVYGVVLRPLPYADPARLVVLWERNIPRSVERNVVAVQNFEAWRERSRAFEAMAGLVPRPVTLAGGPAPERVDGAEVSPGYFQMLGIAPAIGRDFTQADSDAGGAGAVILSHGFWQRRYGGDPAVVGRTLATAGRPHTIIGVMPAGFEPPKIGWLGSQELWFPFVATADNRAWGRFLIVVARLRRDVSLERARAEMTAIGRRLASELPADRGWNVSTVPLFQQMTGGVRATLFVLLGAVGLLLLMAVTNLAILTLSFVRRRAEELALRRSLGATDNRLFRQLFTQSALLGLLGAGVGFLVVSPAVRLLVSLAPPDVPRLESVHVDLPVVLVTAAVALLATIGFGTLGAPRGRAETPVFAGAPDGVDRLSRAQAGGFTLVVAEIAVALALSVSAALMARSFRGLRRVDLGFSADGVLAARVARTGHGDDRPGGHRAFFETLLEQVRGLPNVESACFISARPFGGPGAATEVSDARAPHRGSASSVVADVRYTDAAFFRTLRVPLVRGRLFQSRDGDGPVRVVVSESLARALWPGQDALGREVYLELYGGLTAEVIAVVGDLHLKGPRTAPRPLAYLSDSRFPSDTRDLVLRVNGDPLSIVPALRGVIFALERDVPLYQIAPLSRLVDASVASDRFTTFLLSLFATIALLLSGVGVFGVFSGEVGRRRKEIGIRLALGAKPSALALMLLRRALARTATGVAAGSVLAILLARSMKSLLYGVAPKDPLSFLGVAGLLFALAAVATLIPAVRAIFSSPLHALRES